MKGNSGSKMLLLELVLSVIIFSFCVIVCAGVFFQASMTANKSRSLSGAVFTAQVAAESFVASDGVNELAVLLGGYVRDGVCLVWFDRDWQTCEPELAQAIMVVNISRDGAMHTAEITVNGPFDTRFQLSAAKHVPEVGE